MHFVNINGKPPIRLLRQVGSIEDDELTTFLLAERKFKLRQALRGDRWLDVYDIRRFDGLTDSQRQYAISFLEENMVCMAESMLAVAFVVPAELKDRCQLIADLVARHSVATCVSEDIDEALHWALEVAYDSDLPLDADLVLGGIDAFRFILR